MISVTIYASQCRAEVSKVSIPLKVELLLHSNKTILELNQDST